MAEEQGMSTLKAWRQVVTPHEDIRRGRFDASVFAADLGEVVAGRGAVDYRDPAVFFNKTYLTAGLSDLLTGVMRRLASHKGGEPVVQMQTPFGGGKTHTLLAIYHLLNDPNKVAGLEPIKKLVAEAELKTVPNARIACLVGTAMNVASDRTMWGEMAYQLGGESLYKLVEKEDKAKTAPGSNLLGDLLEKAGPCAILMDEILVYLVNAEKIKEGDWSLRGSTLTFMQQLTIAVANCPHAVMVATLTSQASEWLDTEGAERAYQSLEKVIGRVEKVKLPVEGMEIYEVIRRRLFEDLGDHAEHARTVEAYCGKYPPALPEHTPWPRAKPRAEPRTAGTPQKLRLARAAFSERAVHRFQLGQQRFQVFRGHLHAFDRGEHTGPISAFRQFRQRLGERFAHGAVLAAKHLGQLLQIHRQLLGLLPAQFARGQLALQLLKLLPKTVEGLLGIAEVPVFNIRGNPVQHALFAGLAPFVGHRHLGGELFPFPRKFLRQIAQPGRRLRLGQFARFEPKSNPLDLLRQRGQVAGFLG